MADPSFDVANAHRWFAVELNNLAWDLIEKADRDSEDEERMIHAAHASLWHWMHVGNLVNRQRALCLLACAHAAAGKADQAVHYAVQCAAMSEINGSSQTEFDRATAFACASRAHCLAGNMNDAHLTRTKAMEIAMALDDEDRRVVDGMCGPVHGTPAA